MRELLGKNKSRLERVSTKAPIEFAENPQQPGSATTSQAGAETPLGSNMEEVGENVNEDGQRLGVEKMGQDLEECNPEFLIIERQF